MSHQQDPAAANLVAAERSRRDREARIYDQHVEESGWESAVETACLLDALAPRPDDTVIDAGAGTGRHLKELLERSARVVAVDHSAESLEVARERVPSGARDRLEIHAGDVRSIPLADAVADRILCSEVIQHVPSDAYRLEAARELRRVLRPGGVAVVSAYRWLGHVKRAKEGFWGEDLYRYAFTAREYRTLFRAAGFSQVEIGGMVVFPWLAERLVPSIDVQRRLVFAPAVRHLGDYLLARVTR